MNTIREYLEHYWRATFVAALVVASVWRMRRLSGLSVPAAVARRAENRKIPERAPFRRNDFAAKSNIARREMLKALIIPALIFLGAPPALAAIYSLVPTLPRGVPRAPLYIMYAVAIASMFAFVLRASRLARRSGLVCPACGMELVGLGGTRLRHWSIQQRVLESGKCPSCGEQLLDPTEVGPVSRPATGEQARLNIVFALLLVSTVIFTYFAVKSIRAANLTRCQNRYARALSAADSTVVDSTRVGARRSNVSCGDLRLRPGFDGSEIPSNNLLP
jgi:hypothetical protein